MTTKTKYIKYTFFILVFICFIISYLVWTNNEEDLRNKNHMTIGKVVSWNPGSKTGTWFDYEFRIESTKYSSSIKIVGINEAWINTLLGKNFPVIYNPDNPKNNKLLINKLDFDKFNINQPDSLKKYNKLFN